MREQVLIAASVVDFTLAGWLTNRGNSFLMNDIPRQVAAGVSLQIKANCPNQG